jgi:hypothetical protein
LSCKTSGGYAAGSANTHHQRIRHFRVSDMPSHPFQSLWGNSGACCGQPFKQKEPRSRVRPMASCRLAIIWTVRARRAKVFPPPSPDRPAEACREVSSPRAPVVLGVAFLGRGVRPAGPWRDSVHRRISHKKRIQRHLAGLLHRIFKLIPEHSVLWNSSIYANDASGAFLQHLGGSCWPACIAFASETL